MPSKGLEYPKQPYSTVNRYDSRASYSLETVHQIVNASSVLHVSFVTPDSPFPTVLPMIGQMGSFARPSADTRDVLDLYLHGYVSAQVANLARKAGGAGGHEGADEGTGTGLPLTVAATILDGFVLSLTPNSHSYNYRSAVLFGHALLVTDVEEKLWAMELITNGVVPDRWRHTRVPPTGAEMQSTAVLRVRVAGASAKVRRGPPHDEAADARDPDLARRGIWTGVLPLRLVADEPISAPDNRTPEVPAYLRDFVESFNENARECALEAARETTEGKGKGKGEGNPQDVE